MIFSIYPFFFFSLLVALKFSFSFLSGKVRFHHPSISYLQKTEPNFTSVAEKIIPTPPILGMGINGTRPEDLLAQGPVPTEGRAGRALGMSYTASHHAMRSS